MRLPGPTEAFALFDDARVQGAAPARLYRDPVSVIAAWRMEEVQPALDRIAEAREAGLHADACAWGDPEIRQQGQG